MICIIKNNDKRNECLSQILNDSIYTDNIEEMINIDSLVLPFNCIDRFNYINNTVINIEDILKRNKSLKYIYTIKSNDYLNKLKKDYNFNIIEFLSYNKFKKENSLLTAEGAIRIISNDLNDSLKNLKILILGYGNLGISLVKYLKEYNNKISIYSNNEIEKKMILLNDYNLIEDLNNLEYDLIINTIPFNLINNSNQIIGNPLIYDLSSYPYGFGQEFNKNYKILPQIPGIVLPYATSKIMLEIINENEKRIV